MQIIMMIEGIKYYIRFSDHDHFVLVTNYLARTTKLVGYKNKMI